MQINPLKVEQPIYTRRAHKVAKLNLKLYLVLALTVLASAYFLFTLWLNLSVMKDWPTVTYVDCLFYPWREESIRRKQGTYLIENAQMEERRGRLTEAKRLYASGLEKYPTDWFSRLQLARLNQKDVVGFGLTLMLRDGFKFSAHEKRYIDGVINIAWDLRDYKLVVEACDVGLTALKNAVDQKQRIGTLTERKAHAFLYSGDPLRALATLPKLAENATLEQIVERATILLRLQLPVDAVKFLRESEIRFPKDLKILRLLARAQREIDDIPGMEETLAKNIASNPDKREAWSTVVVNRAKSANPTGARAALERYFVMFYGRPGSLSLMGNELASIGERGLLAECIAESDRLGEPGIDLRELMVELEVSRGDWGAVAGLLTEIAVRRARFNLPAGNWQEFYESLCDAARDGAPAKQNAFMVMLRREQADATAEAYESFIKLLGLEDRTATAQSIALLARQRFPEARDWLDYARKFERKKAPGDTATVE